MSLSQFQSALGALVSGGAEADNPDWKLTDLEKRRLDALAAPGGLDVLRTLSYSWRLTKVLSLLPLTVALLGDETLARYLKEFWRQNKATSLYFVDECLSLLDFLEDRIAEPRPHFQAVVAFERARLELRAELARGKAPRPRRVRFGCNPSDLFDALNAGLDISGIPPANVALEGELTENGSECWTVVEVAIS